MLTRYVKFTLLVALLGVTLVFAGCGDDNNNDPTTPRDPQNSFPTIQGITVTPADAIYVEDTVTLKAVYTDPDNDPLQFVWTKNGGTFDPVEAVGEEIEWTAPSVAGSYEITVIGDDGNGGTSRKHTFLKVIGGNQSGVIVDNIGGVRLNPVGGLGDLGYVDKGDVITLVWDGVSLITVDATQPAVSQFAPDGTNVSTGTPPQYGYSEGLPAANAARYCLIGRIDDSDWFEVTQTAPNTFSITAPARGKLYLSINEQNALLLDNTGYWRFTFSNAH